MTRLVDWKVFCVHVLWVFQRGLVFPNYAFELNLIPCMCANLYFVHTNIFTPSELIIGCMCSAKHAQWTAAFETWRFYYENVLSSLLREVILLMSLWLNYNWQAPKTRCFPAFWISKLSLDRCLLKACIQMLCVEMKDQLWHQLLGTTEPLITAPGVTCQLEILRPGLACFEANSFTKNPSWIMTLLSDGG